MSTPCYADNCALHTDGCHHIPCSYDEQQVWTTIQVEVEILLCKYLALEEDTACVTAQPPLSPSPFPPPPSLSTLRFGQFERTLVGGAPPLPSTQDGGRGGEGGGTTISILSRESVANRLCPFMLTTVGYIDDVITSYHAAFRVGMPLL